MKMLLPHVTCQSESTLMTEHGKFRMLGYIGQDLKSPIIALVVGNPADSEWPLVRLQSKCTTGEAFSSLQCDCKEQLEQSMKQIQSEKNGIIIFLDQEARGNGLLAKLQIYEQMQHGLKSDEACEHLGLPIDIRKFDEAAAILHELNLKQVRLLTNNPEKVNALLKWDIAVERRRIRVTPNPYNYDYLLEKQLRHNHDLGLNLPDLETIFALN